MTHIQPAVDAGHGYLSPSEVNHQPQAVTPRVKAVEDTEENRREPAQNQR